ncbi:CRISPR-associated endonuclease Cas2 [Georgenia sp.]
MTTDAARRFLVAYDIPDDRRRSRLAKALLGYGDRIQYSVFVADCKPAKFLRLKSKVEALVELEADSVLFCDLGPVSSLSRDRFSFVGLNRPLTPNEGIIA